MVISPNDFSLWARLTGNKYPSTPRERAQKGPEVHNFIQNLDKEGMLGGKENEEQKKDNNLGKKIATGALIAGGIAATVAAAKDERVQKIAQRAAATTKNKIDDFLVNFAEPRDVDVDIVNASGDVTPDPSQQQSNTAPTQKTEYDPTISMDELNDPFVNMEPGDPFRPDTTKAEDNRGRNQRRTVDVAGREVSPELAKTIDNFTPVVGGKVYKTEGSIGREDTYGDIGNVPQRVERTYGDLLAGFEKNPKIDASKARGTLTRQTEKGRDFDIAYNRLTDGIDGPPLSDFDATIAARRVAGIDGGTPDAQTPYRKVLQGLRASSVRRLPTNELVNLAVERGNQIILPEGVQESNNQVQTLGTKTPSNLILAGRINTEDNSLTAQKQRSDIVDNVLDDARQVVQRLPRSGPAEPTRQLNLFKAEGDVIGPGETQQEFINRQFSKSAAEAGDPLPEVSGTTIDASRFPGGTMKQRIADLKTANFQALLSGNTTAAMQQAINATGRKVSNGLEYKNNPRLASRDADIISAAQLSGKDFQGNEIYFGPLETKLKQNLKLGTQFSEILDDPTRETVIFQGEERPRTDFEKPVATTASQQRYDDKVQKQLDFREEKIGEADRNFLSKTAAIENMVGKIQESQENIKNIIAGLPERGDLTSSQKQQTARRLGETSNLLKGRLNQERDKFVQAQSNFQNRVEGLMKTTQEKIDNIPVEKTVKSQQGELYDIRETTDPDTGKVTQNIVPAFTRIMDSKQEVDTGVGLEKQEFDSGSSRGSQLEDTGSRRRLLDINELKGRGPEADQIRLDLIESASKQGVDLFDVSTEGRQKAADFLSNKQIISDPINVGERMVGTPTGIAGDIAKIYRTGDPATVNQRINEFKERLKRQQATKLAGGLTIEDIQDL